MTQDDIPALALSLPGAWEKGRATQLAIGRMDADKLSDLVRLAWRGVAPRRLAAG